LEPVTTIDQLIRLQTRDWPLAAQNYAGLNNVIERRFQFEGFQVKAQFNPERIRSSAAKTDKTSIAERPCFLCKKNRPEEQVGLDFQKKYEILINPYPIFQQHLTIVGYGHVPQRIANRLPDLLDLAQALPGFTVFYNGPKCGASAPDHFHFQAGQKNTMPVDPDTNDFLLKNGEQLLNTNTTTVYAAPESYLRHLLVFESTDREALSQLVAQTIALLPQQENETEPMLNILAHFDHDHWQILLFPREKQRPRQYFREGKEQLLVSPASVEMGGLVILPRREDFDKISREDLTDIFRQVSLNKETFDDLKEKIKAIY
jgi:hypothetical protein